MLLSYVTMVGEAAALHRHPRFKASLFFHSSDVPDQPDTNDNPRYKSGHVCVAYCNVVSVLNSMKGAVMMMRRNSIDIMIETAIRRAVATTRQSLQRETPQIETQEINRASLAALARVTAQEIVAAEQRDNTEAVLEYLPQGPGTEFLIELQEEMRRLYRHKQ
jgi:hypothetical protein